MKHISLTLTVIILLFQITSYANSTFEVALTAEIIISDSIVNVACTNDCNGEIFITYEVWNPDYTPTSFTWKNEKNEIIETQQHIIDLCPGNYTLTISFQNGQDSTLYYSVIQNDDSPPTINSIALTYSLTRRFDDSDLGTTTEIIGDSLIAVGVPCVFGVTAVEDYFLDYEDSIRNYTTDNCDLDLQVTFSNILYENEYYQSDSYPDFVASMEYFVSDNSGNMDSIEIMFYTAVFYQPIIELLEVIDDKGIITPYNLQLDKVTDTIFIDQNSIYTISAQVDPVCVANTTELRWDLNNDGFYDSSGFLKNFSDSAGIFKMKGQAFGINIQNSFSNEIFFTVKVLGFNIWETIYPSECGSSCSGDILIDYEYIGDDYQPQTFTWKDVNSGEIVGIAADLLDTCAGNYELTIEFKNAPQISSEYTIGIEDTTPPVIDFDLIEDFLSASDLEGRPGGYFYDPNIQSKDTLIVGGSCTVNSTTVEVIFDEIISNFNSFASDDCDDQLNLIASETVFDNKDFLIFLTPERIDNPEYFLASKTISVLDDYGNQSNIVLIVFIHGWHSPVFNSIIAKYENEPPQLKDSILIGSAEEVEIEYLEGKNIAMIINVDPVCDNALLEIKWDIKENGAFGTIDFEGDSILILMEEPKSVELQIDALSTGILNPRSKIVDITLTINGIKPEYTYVLDCETECNNKVTATVNNFGIDYAVNKVEWMDLNENVVSNTAIATGLCFHDYLFRVYLSSGVIKTDTVELEVDVTSTIKDITCAGDNDGSIVIDVVKGFKNYSISWNDSNKVVIGQDDHIENLGPGIYSLELISPESNCPYVEEFEIKEGILYPTAAFSFDINGANPILFVNESTNATSYSWDFGDGQMSNTLEEEFEYLYNVGGIFEVTLISYNERGCQDTIRNQVEIKVTGLQEIESSGIHIFPNPVFRKILNVQFEEKYIGSQKMLIIDSNGNNVKTHIHTGNTQLNLSDLSDGMYFLLVESNGEFYRKKILKASE